MITNVNKELRMMDEERILEAVDVNQRVADRGLRNVNYDDFLPYK